MKEDILEQLAEDYLQAKGYFTVTNVKFRPSRDDLEYVAKDDRVFSDIDVLGVHPCKQGAERVVAISCKSYQEGFWPEWYIQALEENKIVGGKEAWRHFRELWVPKWGKAFRSAVKERTGEDSFVYMTAVTRLNSERVPWERCARFNEVLGCTPRLITLEEMINAVLSAISETVAGSQLSRTLQLMKAAGYFDPDEKKRPNHVEQRRKHGNCGIH